MIRTFGDRDTERLWNRERVPAFAPFERMALRKLFILHSATSLQDLARVPGNRLELLKGNRKGQRSIRINDQYRVCFTWKTGHAFDVIIEDYH